MASIPESHCDLLAPERKSFLQLATLMPDGTPQLTPVWFLWDGDHVVVNSARGRVKDRNMRARPDVACVIMDPDNPYRYMQIRGRVVEITEEGAVDVINQMSEKYRGRRNFEVGDNIRVTYRIAVDDVSVSG